MPGNLFTDLGFRANESYSGLRLRLLQLRYLQVRASGLGFLL